MARKKPVHPNQVQQTTDKSVDTHVKNTTKIAWIPFLILVLYMAVHFIPNMEAIDVLGPQWLYLSILDTGILLFLLIHFQNKHIKISILIKPVFSKILLLLLILAGISISFSINIIESIVCFSRFTTTVLAYFNILLFLLLYDLKNAFINLAKALSIITIIESCIGIHTLLTDGTIKDLDKVVVSITSNTGNKNIFAASIVIKIPFILYAIIYSKTGQKIFYSFALAIGITQLLLLGARSSYLSLAACTSLYTIYILLIKKDNHRIKKVKLLSYLWTPLILGFFASLSLQSYVNNFQSGRGVFSNVANRLTDISVTNESSSYRLMLWKHALSYISEHPFIGCGYGNWKLASIPYEKEYINDLTVPAHAHNDFLEHATELGLLGGVLYALLFVSLFWGTISSLRSNTSEEIKSISVFSFLGIVVYGIDALFNFPIERPIMQVLFALLAAVNVSALILSRDKQVDIISKQTPIISEKKILTRSILICLLIITPSLYINNLTYISLRAQMKVIPDLKNEPMTLPLAEVTNIFPPIPNLTSSSQPIDAIIGRYYSENKQYDEALRLLRKAMPYNPYIYYSHFLIANVYFLTDKLDSAKYYAETAYYNRPRANTYYQTLIAVEAKRKDTAALGKAFRTYTHYRNEVFPWQLYILGMLNALQRGTPELLKLTDSALNMFKPAPNTAPSTDYQQLLKRKEEVEKNMNVTVTNTATQEDIKRATAVYNEAVEAFGKGDFASAARKFVAAINISPFSYSMYENAGICYYNLKEYKKAIYYFDKVIAMKITNDGKSEFFKGASYVNSGNREEGCKSLQIAAAKNYPGTAEILKQFCK